MTSLGTAIEQYGPEAYLLTIGESGPHTSVVSVDLEGARLRLSVGKTARANAAANKAVSVLWPAKQAGGYSIIVNGDLAFSPGDPTAAEIAITKSVFHRPGVNADPDTAGGCGSDCKPLSLS